MWVQVQLKILELFRTCQRDTLKQKFVLTIFLRAHVNVIRNFRSNCNQQARPSNKDPTITMTSLLSHASIDSSIIIITCN